MAGAVEVEAGSPVVVHFADAIGTLRTEDVFMRSAVIEQLPDIDKDACDVRLAPDPQQRKADNPGRSPVDRTSPIGNL